jgi:TolA-binding protein
MALGDGAPAVGELLALPTEGPNAPFTSELRHYWLGLAHLLAFEWSAAAHEFRSFLAGGNSTWRAGWAYLHLGRAYQQAGRMDEASLAFRGCLSVADAERPARKMAFDLMSRIANSVPVGYGQAPTRPAHR